MRRIGLAVCVVTCVVFALFAISEAEQGRWSGAALNLAIVVAVVVTAWTQRRRP